MISLGSAMIKPVRDDSLENDEEDQEIATCERDRQIEYRCDEARFTGVRHDGKDRMFDDENQ